MTAESVPVTFSGAGSGVGALTWGQKGLWQAMGLTGSSLPLGGSTPMRAGTTVAEMARMLRFEIERHPSLRTRLRFPPDGPPEQETAGAGETALAVVDAGTDDPGVVAERLRIRWEGEVFDYAREWPVRMAAVTAGGAVTHMVVVYCHLALDLFGLEVLVEDLATMDRRTGTSPVPADATTPLDLARRQDGPAERRRGAASLRYWDRLLRAVPARRFPGSADRRTPRWVELTYRSPAALQAVRLLAARSGLRTGPLLTGAAAVGLAGLTDAAQAVLQVLVSNRFRPGLARAVTPLTQSALCVADVAGPLPEVAARCQRGMVTAGKYAWYDPAELDALRTTVDRERGEPVDVDCFVNDRRRVADHDGPGPVPDAAAVRAALPASTLRAGGLDRFDHRLFLHVNDVPDAVEWTVCADTHQLDPAAAEALLVRMEATLVDAALAG